MSKSFYEKINLFIVFQYESEHVMRRQNHFISLTGRSAHGHSYETSTFEINLESPSHSLILSLLKNLKRTPVLNFNGRESRILNQNPELTKIQNFGMLRKPNHLI